MNTGSFRQIGWVSAALSLGLALASGCATKPATVGASAPPAVFSGPPADRARVVADLQKKMAGADYQVDEFDEMVLQTNMDGAQLGAFLAAVQARADKLAQWEAGAAGAKRKELKEKVAKARATQDAALAAAQKELQPLDEEYGALRNRVRAEVMAVMTLDQQRDWAVYVLWGHWGQLSGRFANLALTEKQEAEARRIVREEMNRIVGPKTVAEDPYLKILRTRGNEDVRVPIVKRIAKEVLTADQKKGLGE